MPPSPPDPLPEVPQGNDLKLGLRRQVKLPTCGENISVEFNIKHSEWKFPESGAVEYTFPVLKFRISLG